MLNIVYSCIDFDFTFYEIYSHLGLENKSNTWCPILYLTYSGVGKDGKALFWGDKKMFNKILPSLKNNGGLVPDCPGREERAKL